MTGNAGELLETLTRTVCMFILYESIYSIYRIYIITMDLGQQTTNLIVKINESPTLKCKQTPEICLEAVKEDGCALRYIIDQTPDICMSAVQQNGEALRYVKHQTPQICIEAVNNCSAALEYVQNPSHEICMSAVTKNGLMLHYIDNPSPELCLAAVKQNGMALKYIKNQTPDICINAVKQNGNALQYVHEKTTEICIYTINQNLHAVLYVLNQTPEICSIVFKRWCGSILKHLNFDKVNNEDTIQDTINVNNYVIIYEDLQANTFKYINKKNNLYETVLSYISSAYSETEAANVKKIYENEQNDDSLKCDIAGLYITKVNDTYELFDKTIETINNGWLINNYNSQTKIKKFCMASYTLHTQLLSI